MTIGNNNTLDTKNSITKNSKTAKRNYKPIIKNSSKVMPKYDKKISDHSLAYNNSHIKFNQLAESKSSALTLTPAYRNNTKYIEHFNLDNKNPNPSNSNESQDLSNKCSTPHIGRGSTYEEVHKQVVSCPTKFSSTHYGYRFQIICKRRFLSVAYAFLVVLNLMVNYYVAYLEMSFFDPACCKVGEKFYMGLSGMATNSTNQSNSTSSFSFISKNIDLSNLKRYDIIIFFCKWFMTISTIVLLYISVQYFNCEALIFRFDNNLPIDEKIFVLRKIRKLKYFWPCTVIRGQPYDANEIDEADQIWFLRRHLKKIILEIIVFIFHPFWLPNNRINFFSAEKHPFLDSLYFFMFFRLVFAVRVFVTADDLFYSARKQMVATINRFSIGMVSKENMSFILRSQIEKNSFSIVLMTVMTWCSWSSFQIYLYEWRHYLNENIECTEGDCAGYSYLNAFWLVWISFMTVGYGDFSPISFGGKILIMIQCLISIMTTSVLISVVTLKLTMNQRERKVQFYLKENQLNHEIRHKAATVLQRLWRARQMLRQQMIDRIRNYPNAHGVDHDSYNTNSSGNERGAASALMPKLRRFSKVILKGPPQSILGKAIASAQAARLEESEILDQPEVIEAIHNFVDSRNRILFKSEKGGQVETMRLTFRGFDDKFNNLSQGMTENHEELNGRVDRLADRVGRIEDRLEKILDGIERLRR